MESGEFYETVLDNIPDGIYILDDKGNYIFANSTYIRRVNMTKAELLAYSVYDFEKNKQIDVCISDIVYREKRQVVMFQDVSIAGIANYRQLVISNPILENGQVRNIVAVCKPLDIFNNYCYEADSSGVISTLTLGENNSENHDSEKSLIVAKSQAMQMLFEKSQALGDIDAGVLITGESGAGKEVIVKCIHKSGRRSKKPMVVVNCASLPENLLEAELFGYEKGAFTGAVSGGKPGLFEIADGSTLFLDEINSLPLSLQGKLLRTIETKVVQRIGATKGRTVDFRLIYATNEDLWSMVEEKRFRADLFYRINVISLLIPPLRERPEDIIPLATLFMRHYCDKYNKYRTFTQNTIKAMMNYSWPGNVRELKNFVERSVVMSTGDLIEIENISPIAASGNWRIGNPKTSATPSPNEGQFQKLLEDGVSLQEYLEQCEQRYMHYALSKHNNTYATAVALGTSQSSIMRKKRKYGL